MLTLATIAALILRLRTGSEPNPILDNLDARIKAWWVMIIVLGLAFLAGRNAVIVLPLSPSRRGVNSSR